MAKENYISDDEVEIEIERLRKDPDVALAKAEERIRNKRRQYLYQLRNYKKRGANIRNDPEYEWLVDMCENRETTEGDVQRE